MLEHTCTCICVYTRKCMLSVTVRGFYIFTHANTYLKYCNYCLSSSISSFVNIIYGNIKLVIWNVFDLIYVLENIPSLLLIL